MATEQIMKHCRHCDDNIIHLQQKPSHVLHLLLTIFTVGIWLPIWILVAIDKSGHQCTRCATKTSTVRAKPIAIALGVFVAVLALLALFVLF